MKHSFNNFILPLLLTTLISCSPVAPLMDKDFEHGDWLLVNFNGAKSTLKIIDDEKVLQQNTNGIRVDTSESDHYTTCDGIIKLFKDGKLIIELNYLDDYAISESSEIKNAYKKASDETLYPNSSNDFKQQWDSLKKVKNNYPTLYNTQPDDVDAIWLYRYE